MLTAAVTSDPGQLVHLDAAGLPGVGREPLFGLDSEALAARMAAAGEPAWRGRQLAEAMYRQRLTELSEITTLPRQLRQRLAGEGWQLGRPRIAQTFTSVDGTERYLIVCGSNDAQTVETVWMPEGDDGESGDESDAAYAGLPQTLGAPGPGFPRTGLRPWGGDLDPETRENTEAQASSVRSQQRLGAPGLDFETGDRTALKAAPPKRERPEPRRATICVSSQVGCAVNCQFCLTAKLGLQRNLTAGEIAGQVLAVLDRHQVEVGRDRVNLVFMGMGEPFLNYDNFSAAVRLLITEAGLSPRRMTVSTSGIVPGIERFAREPPEFRPKLAISLNAPNNAVRSEIMPINRKWPIEAVIDAVRKVPLRPRERITFEYVLLAGVTDRPEHAKQVARLARRTGLPIKVNLIAWNPGPGIAYSMPDPASIEAFKQALIAESIPVYLRKPRGRDIYAACGQLKRTVEG
jgi:23S rRNA (adenine2503-C2)-methyltransferase